MTKEERLVWQKAYRQRTQNMCTKTYEKTIKGFLMRLYRNMKSRITGVQRQKAHLYKNKPLLDKDTFYDWATASPVFYSLFGEYKHSGFKRALAPSVDRVDSSRGYELDNMEWVTMSENSKRGNKSKHQKNLSHS